jgi:hypothetical protein
MRIPTGTAIGGLRSGLRGGLCEPGHPEYTDMCTHFNATIEHRPQLVAPLSGRGRCDRLARVHP